MSFNSRSLLLMGRPTMPSTRQPNAQQVPSTAVDDLLRRPASSARARRARGRRTACSCPGSTATRARPSTLPADRRRRRRPARRRRASPPRRRGRAPARCVTRASASDNGDAILGRPLERERQQQLEAGGAGLRLAERHLLAVVVDRRVVGADDVDRAVRHARAQRVAVARAAQRRHQVRLRSRTSRCRRRTGAGDGRRRRT